MKKILLVIVVILVLAIPVTVYLVMQRQDLRKRAAPATSLTLNPTVISQNVGDEFSVDVLIDTADNQAVAAELHISYDPTLLEVESITNGPLFPHILASGAVTGNIASITVGADSTTPVKGTGIAATLKLKALKNTTTPTSLAFSKDTVVAGLGEGSTNILVSSNPTTITIGGAGSQSSSSSNLTPTATPPTSSPPINASPSAGISTSSAIQVVVPESTNSATPTIKGKAPPGATVTITIYSTPKTVTVVADANGNYSYTLTIPLDAGPHNVVASVTNPNTGEVETTSTTLVIAQGETSSESAIPTAGNPGLTVSLLGLGLLLFLSGMLIPIFTLLR